MYPETVVVHATVKDTVEFVISSISEKLDIPATRFVLATLSRDSVNEVTASSSINVLISSTVVVYVVGIIP